MISALARPSQQQSKEFCSDSVHLTFPFSVLIVYYDTLLIFTCQQKNANFLKNPNNASIHKNQVAYKTKPLQRLGYNEYIVRLVNYHLRVIPCSNNLFLSSAILLFSLAR